MSDEGTPSSGPASFGLPPEPPQPPGPSGPAVPGGPGEPAAPPRSGGSHPRPRWRQPSFGTVIALACALIVLVVGAFAIFVVPRAKTPTPVPVATAPEPARTSQPPLAGPTPSPPAVPAIVPGWQTVEGREFVAFDVPPDWKIEGGDVIVGFETHAEPDAPQLVVMHNVASYKNGVCPNLQASNRGRAGFVVPGKLTARAAAPELSQQWAEVAALDDGGDHPIVGKTATQQVKIAGGTMTATESTTILTITHPEPCQAPSMAFTAVSFEVKGTVVVFVIWTDEGVADSLPAESARMIISSLRPIGS